MSLYQITFYLNSGKEIKVVCEDWLFDTDSETGQVLHHDLRGVREYEDLKIASDQIAAYTILKVPSIKGK